MTIKLKDFDKVLKEALIQAELEVKKPSSMLLVARFTLSRVLKRIRLGYGVDKTGNNKEKFKPLSKSYIQQRKGNLGFWTNKDGQVVPINTLSSKEAKQFRASKSAKNQAKKNKAYLKRTLPPLASTTSASRSNVTRTGKMLESLGVTAGIGKFKILFKSSKERKKASYVVEDRPFMNLSRLEIKAAEKLIKKLLDEAVKKIKF